MRVLHLFANSKWTGPAEPALILCAALRDHGIDTQFACAAGPDIARNQIVQEARIRALEPLTHLHLAKHRNPVRNFMAVRALRRRVADHPVDLIHCHLDNDHTVAVAARTGVPIVRTSYYGDGFPHTKRAARLLAKTDYLIECSSCARKHDVEECGADESRTIVISPTVNLKRFDPNRPLTDMRSPWRLPENAVVVGIVARIQRHRHFEDLWSAAQTLCAELPKLHFVVVGRGTHEAEVAREPVAALGLSDRVHFAGYLRNDDYVAALAAFDIKVFLVPGSDGTCRAVREAMAMGKPVVAANRGMLPEIVDHDLTGLIFGESAVDLAACIRSLVTNPERRCAMGAAARAKAEREYAPEVQATHVVSVYQRVMERRK